MSNRKKRVYDSRGRQAQAALTNGRILASAKKLFQTEGFESVTIDSIAKAANVSAPTIYSLFQSKRGVLRALMDQALPSERRESLVEEVRAEKSPQKRLGLAAKISRQMYDAERAQMDVFRGASVLAPEFRELEKEREQRRYKRQEDSTRTMAEEGHLAKGITLSKAQDILWAFTGRDLYRMLVVEQGWTSDAYEKWLAQFLIKTLIGE